MIPKRDEYGLKFREGLKVLLRRRGYNPDDQRALVRASRDAELNSRFLEQFLDWTVVSPRSDSLRKMLKHLEATEADLLDLANDSAHDPRSSDLVLATDSPKVPANCLEAPKSGEPDSFVLVYLRRFDTKMDDLRADIAEVKQRLTTLEVQIASLSATESSHYAQVMQRLDRHEGFLNRIERQLELTAVPATA